ncbi:MAG: uroporphyrinogen-III synthase [Gemmataceae bacterium]
MPLEGKTIALAEGRQLEELAAMLENEGATPLRYPMLSILDAPAAGPIDAWLDELCRDRFALVILMTGEALRRLLGFADRAGKRDAVIAALGRTRTLTRGPKPVKALREINLSPSRVAEAPTTAGVVAALASEELAGKTVGYTLYAEPNEPLDQALRAQDVAPRPVMPYIYAPASDADKVVELIRELDAGKIDATVFTSSPQVDRLFEVAAKHKLDAEVRRGLEKTCVAAVGPVVADTLKALQVRVDVCPESSYFMKNLVLQMKKALPAT